MKIVIDAFGGDHAPLEIIKGTIEAKQYGEQLALTGSVEAIQKCAAENGLSLDGIELIEAPQIMDMHDDAKLVIKQKADSSMGKGLQMVANGEADAIVSAGPTGALLMGGTMVVKRIKGVKRPAIGAVIPGLHGNFLLMDCGANVECRPEMLDQFGVLGSTYMKKLFGLESPKVGLANNGAEESKGTELQIEAYKLMAQNKHINFAGNVEGRDIPMGDVDVVVADGFTGNMILKVTEGMGLSMLAQLKGMLTKNIGTKMAAAILKPGLRAFRDKNDSAKVGGAPIIGLQKPVIKAHGSSNAEAIKNAIRQAIQWSGAGVSEAIAEALAE